MKKNRMMRLASILLVLVLMTSSVVGGTFAKYTYTTNGSDEARVAKWGVSATINGGAFATEYAADSATSIAMTVVTDPTGDGKQLVAPGTTGSFAGISLTGKPEVAVLITNTATLDLAGWEVDGAYYCPIVITINGTPYAGMDYSSAADFAADVEAAIEAANGEYEANTDLATDVAGLNGNYTWAWEFGDPANNDKDTKLGDAAALGNAATIKLSVVTLVEQIN